MRILTVFLLLQFAGSSLYAQQVTDLTEGQPYSNNGLEYSFYITNEKNKEIKGEDFDRYEVEISVTNKSGCLKLIPLRTGSANNSNNEVQIAEFNCVNATGKRLTAKKGNVNARPWYTNVRIPDETVKEKFRMVYAQVGYAIRDGQTISSRIIVIVPKGERPKFNCRLAYFPELN
jgi:hypothetical protein